MKTHKLIILSFIGGLSALTAQNAFFKTHPFEEPFKHVQVRSLYKDGRDLLWLGTKGGLFSFDGLSYTPYLKQDSSSNDVTAIYHSRRNDQLWVGYQDGTIYRVMDGHLVLWKPEEGLPKVPIVAFLEDREGRFWFATYGEGLYYMDGGRMYNFDVEDGLLGADIYDLEMDADERMLVATDRGISICSVVNKKKLVENIGRAEGLPDEIVHTLLPDRHGNFWIGMYDRGICYYDVAEDAITTTIPNWDYGIVNQLEIFEDQELWIGTNDFGIWRYDIGTAELSSIRSAAAQETGNRIYDLLKGPSGNIWVASNSKGVWSVNRQFEFFATWMSDTQCALVDRSGNWWIGSQEGLFRRELTEDSKYLFKKVLSDRKLNVLSLYEDPNGILWIGTFGNGLYCWDPNSDQLRHFLESDGLTNNNVLSITGKEGVVWLATLGGVTRFENDVNIISKANPEVRRYHEQTGLGINYVYQVLIDRKGRVWFATDGEGISVLENGIFTNYTEINLIADSSITSDDTSIEIKAVYSIAEDGDGDIWFSTAQKGVVEFDGQNFRGFNENHGLRNLAITSMITDRQGGVVLVHSDGIDVINPENYRISYYDEEIGIFGINSNLNAVCHDHGGNVLITTDNEIIRYSPSLERFATYPTLYFARISVVSREVNLAEEPQFIHSENQFTFEYQGLWYPDPEVVKYRYRLHGYDPYWRASKDISANYANLAPGDYLFEVSASASHRWTEEPVLTYPFTILPPFWRRWWFIVISLGVLAGTVICWQRMRERRLRRVSLLEKQKVESELAALKAQINPHFLFNSFNALIETIEENPAKAVEYVEKLSDFYRSLLQYRHSQLIPLVEEIDLIHNFEFLLRKRFGSNFAIRFDIKEKEGFIPPLALQILVENAVKHNVISKSKPLIVAIQSEEKNYISVTNELQRKFHKSQSTHFGLEGLTKRYELLGNYRVRISQTERYFKVSIPLVPNSNP